jgi:CRP-like cAMP-binding protein
MLSMLRQNHLLIALSEVAKKRLFGHMDWVALQQGEILYESCETISHVYFPVDSIISLHNVMGSGDSAEVSVVGNEGLADISLFLGGDSTFSRAVVQSAGRAYRIPGELLQDEFNHHSELKILILRYIQTLII